MVGWIGALSLSSLPASLSLHPSFPPSLSLGGIQSHVMYREQDALPNLKLHKQSVGCNTRYAANNPFDAKVLKALTPNTSLDESKEEEDMEAGVDGLVLPGVVEHVRVSTPGSMTGI
jgi:hypothetical protein